MHISAADNPPAIRGAIDDINLKFAAGKSKFGNLGPALLALLSRPLNAVVNDVALPILNRMLHKGVPIPSVSTTVAGYHLTVTFSSPEIDLSGGTVLLVGTDAAISLVPPRGGDWRR